MNRNIDYDKEFQRWVDLGIATDRHNLFKMRYSENKDLIRSAFIGGMIRAMDIQNEKTNLAGDGEIWSAIRTLLAQGEAIYQDYKDKPIEEYSARVDAAARERVEWLKTRLRKAR